MNVEQGNICEKAVVACLRCSLNIRLMDEIPILDPDPSLVLPVTSERNCHEWEFSGEFCFPESLDLATFLKVQLYLFVIFCHKRQLSNLGSFRQENFGSVQGRG